jgi:hypothetical protein
MKTLILSLLLVTGLRAALPADYYPRVLDLGNGLAARLTRVDKTDIGYELGTGTTAETFVPTKTALGVPPIAGFDPATAEAWPTDAVLAAQILNPPAPAPTVPAEVGSGQIRAAMIASGIAADNAALDTLITTALTNAIADPTQRAIALALWGHATTFKRANAWVATAQTALGKTDAEIDTLFILAASF